VRYQEEIREFLRAKRAQLSPQQVGIVDELPRRVPGLRRSEVAQLAGVSTSYYRELERGNIRGVSVDVLRAVAKALQLTDRESQYLINLLFAQDPWPYQVDPESGLRVDADLLDALDHLEMAPTFVTNQYRDMVAVNPLGWATHLPFFQSGVLNMTRFDFTVPQARDFRVDWEKYAALGVEVLRQNFGRNGDNERIGDLIAEFQAVSPDFKRMWQEQRVEGYPTGPMLVDVPGFGRLNLHFVSFHSSTDANLQVLVHTVEPGSPSEEILFRLRDFAAAHGVTKSDLTVNLPQRDDIHLPE
jgi:transcriptional regulator with XRE-family HTH domain